MVDIDNEKTRQFECILSLITSDDIKAFTEVLISKAEPYFFNDAASSTGKYHPSYALGHGGLARHSIAVAFIMNEFLRTDCYAFTDREKDLLRCAALVHDIKKYGNGGTFTVKEHPELAGEYVMNTAKETGLISDCDAKFIASAIETHMGQWGTKEPTTDAEKLLHMADCLTSRKWIEIDFKNEDLNAENALAENVRDYGSKYAVPFGMYKGKTLDEIYDINPSYIEFLAFKMESTTHPVIAKARMLLEKKHKRQ